MRTARYPHAVLVALFCSNPLLAQTPNPLDLPNAPGASRQFVATTQATPATAGSSQVSGVVQDTDGNIITTATITLSAPGALGEHTVTTDSDGRFTFTGLAPGQYRLIVTAPGFTTYTSAVLTLASDQVFAQPPIQLQASITTSVNVVASPQQIALAEVHGEEQQRVFGVFPNFYTSYIWTAQPMTAGQKFQLATRSLIDPVEFFTVAGTAGAEQLANTYPGYGTGITAYGKLYAAAFADATDSRMLGSAVFPAIFHQDPRYFYQGSGTVRSRTRHAIASAFFTRSDSGGNQLNYAHLLGSLSAAALANAYHPAQDRSAGVTFQTFGITVAGNIGQNLFREFVLRGLVPSVPSFANGRAPTTPSHGAP